MRTEVRFRAFATIALLVTCAVAPLRAQDLARDLPWRRPDPALSSTELLDAGLERLAAGWGWEAARMFRELAHREPERAIAHLGLALSLRSNNNRAARLVWQANKFVGKAPAPEAAIVAAYREYFGVDRQPELVDAAFAAEPWARAGELVAALARINDPRAAALAKHEQMRQMAWRSVLGHCDVGDAASPESARDFVMAANSYLQRTGAMPFLVPSYRSALCFHGSDAALLISERLPRHPQLSKVPVIDERRAARCIGTIPAAEVPGFGPQPGVGLEWQPRLAPAFDLPRGLNGRGKLADYAGKPVLVVFFLGFG